MSFKNGVLEGSGLDFGGSGPRFWRVLGRIFRDFGLLGKENAGTDFELAAKAARFQLEAPVARSSYSYFELRPRFSRRGGGRRWSPPGGLSIRRPPKVCQRRAEFISNWLCPITAGQSRHSFAQFDLKCFFPYPFLSPPAWGSPEPSYKFALAASCWDISAVFFAFRIALEK